MCCNCASTHRDPTVRPTGALYCRQASKQSTKGTTRKNAFITCSQKCGKLLSRDGAHNTSSIVLKHLSVAEEGVLCNLVSRYRYLQYSFGRACSCTVFHYVLQILDHYWPTRKSKTQIWWGGEDGVRACVRACVSAHICLCVIYMCELLFYRFVCRFTFTFCSAFT